MVVSRLADLHSDVAESPGKVAAATVRVADHDIADAAPGRLTRLAAPLDGVLTAELDGAAAGFGLAADEILLAALGRAIARTIGEGVVSVDVVGTGHPIPLHCATAQRLDATDTLAAVHSTLTALPRHQWGPGLPQSFYTARGTVAVQDRAHSASEIAFNDLGDLPAAPSDGPVWATRGLRRVLELRVFRTDGLVHLEWWYDARRFFPSTVEELAEQFPLALIELTSEAVAPI